MREEPSASPSDDRREVNVPGDVVVESAPTTGTTEVDLLVNADRNEQSLRSKAAIKSLRIGTLNIRGLKKSSGTRENKLDSLARVMKANKWGLVALQETHETVEMANLLEITRKNYWCFPNPGTKDARGTLVVVNSSLFNHSEKDEVTNKVIIEGRAQLVTIKWTETISLKVLNVYLPNDNDECIEVIDSIKSNLGRVKPDLVLGDFNHIENAIDRWPNRGPPPLNVRTKLKELNEHFGLVDGWRDSHENEKSFTYTSDRVNRDGTRPRSRIDRILTSFSMTSKVYEYTHETSQGLSDHDFALVEITDDSLPHCGKNRWRVYEEDLEDDLATESIRKVLLACERRLDRVDPVREWLETKRKIKNIFIGRQRMRAKDRGKNLYALKRQLKETQNSVDLDRDKQLQLDVDALRHRIEWIETEKIAKATQTSRARYAAKGETVSKYWLSMNKERQQDSIIRALENDQGIIVTDTDGMTKIATEYHKKLQARPEMNGERREAVRKMSNLINTTPMSLEDRMVLIANVTSEDVANAIKSGQSNKAPGLDGLSYEFYKQWMEMEESQAEDDEQVGENDPFNHERVAAPTKPEIPSITNILTKVYNAISNGEAAPEEYVVGLMSILYKKKDKRKIENYRPITLLNSDYKIQTKIIAKRLGATVQSIIHLDQAGFVPGRDILDHVKLAKVITEYCDVTKTNGCIVALDQEKAYDKIDHEYLWKILRAFGIPQEFIKTIKNLYKNAKTSVMINRVIPKPYNVERGVRQGDPMSCILFDLAIEPLAESLRRSNLKGIKVPGAAERIICKLFADDTLVYLSKKDKLSRVFEITDEWCLASTAKFNIDKTEFLPIGSKSYRKKVEERRSLSDNSPPADKIKDEFKLITEGSALRTLGGWVGNNVDVVAIWEPIVNSIEKIARAWGKHNLTLKGRKIIVTTLMISKMQYLLMTNDPPKEVIEKIERSIRTFMWKGKARGLMKIEELYKPETEGGLGLPDIRTKQSAARLMWVKKWRLPESDRPIWVDIFEKLTQKCIKTSRQTVIEESMLTSMLDQTWREVQTSQGRLSEELRMMIKEAFNHGVEVDAPKFALEAKLQAPVWLSRKFDGKNTQQHSVASKQLREYHGVITMRDAMRVRRERKERCPRHHLCMNKIEDLQKRIQPKLNPVNVTPKKARRVTDKLDHTPRRIRTNESQRIMGEEICLNPDVTHRRDMAYATRIFTNKEDVLGKKPAYRDTMLPDIPGRLTIWTDGSADKNGMQDSKCGAGVWCLRPEYRASIRVSGNPQSNNRGEIAAVVWALEKVPKNQQVIIMTDSSYVLNGLAKDHVKWEDRGWLGTVNADMFKRALYLMRRRTAETFIKKVKAHSGIDGNENADAAAKAALEKPEYDVLDLNVPKEWSFKGARLSALKFRHMYKWVREMKPKQYTTRSGEVVQDTLEHLKDKTGKWYKPEDLWKSIRKDPMKREHSDFLWKALHARTECGEHFKHWPGWEEKQFCKDCGGLETLEHILITCQDRPWKDRLWREATKLLKSASATKSVEWGRPTYYDILGVGLLDVPSGARRLAKIVIVETAFMVWKLRNAMVIDEASMSEPKAVAAWNKAMARRAVLDMSITRLPEVRAGGTEHVAKVRATWEDLVDQPCGRLRWIYLDNG